MICVHLHCSLHRRDSEESLRVNGYKPCFVHNLSVCVCVCVCVCLCVYACVK